MGGCLLAAGCWLLAGDLSLVAVSMPVCVQSGSISWREVQRLCSAVLAGQGMEVQAFAVVPRS